MTYDRSFFRYVDETALASAEVIVPIVVGALHCRSVLDVGCGTGAWLSVYARRGVEDVVGADGDYVQRDMLMIAADRFVSTDLTHGFDFGRQFDLVQSLEVAEHLPASASDRLVDTLCSHAGTILFSAAVPGQGGEHHVNEQPYERWRARFAARGFAPYDFVRPRLKGNPDVAPWYAYNTLLYAHERVESSLPLTVSQTRVPVGSPIPDLSPASFRIRKALLRPLPPAIVTRLARLKRRLRNDRVRPA